MQGTCNSHGRFLDVMIKHPATTSDYLAFSTSALKHKLEKNGFFAPKLCLFGNNAYVNTLYMATSYKGATGGTKDNCNFYQSQVRALFWKNKILWLVSHHLNCFTGLNQH
jgi:hypothetical protein